LSLDVRLLGPLEVVAGDGGPIHLGPMKQRAVLALLALQPGRVVPAERIADELWGDSVPASAVNTLHAYVSRLRKALGTDVIVTRQPGYVLGLAPEAVDVRRFEEASEEARVSLTDDDPIDAAQSARRALELWRGEPFVDLIGIPALEREASRLVELRLRTIEDRIDADLRCGRHTDVAAELPVLITEHPLRERLSALCMLALYRCGRQADALQCYTDLRERLADELGVDPSPDVQRLQTDILRQDASLDWTPVPSVADPGPPSNVPQPVTSFVGREDELTTVKELLASNRLVTLTGPGGAGKTRLAIEVARAIGDAWFVPLAGLDDAAQIAEHVATSLSLRDLDGASAFDALAARLHAVRGVLVLDNCEHLADASARFAHDLLSSCAELCVLTTSRERLRASGEVVFRVPPLAIADPQDTRALRAPSVALFVDRARAIDPQLVPERHTAAIVELCRRLDGMPLAIELAAARCDVLSPEEIAERLADALGLLTSGPVTDEPHHHSLRAAMEWSHRALSDDEQRLFRTLGVFSGPFTAADAEAVFGEPALDGLSRLVALSIVEASEAGSSKLLSLLEIVRSYAIEKLDEAGETVTVQRRHLRHYAAAAKSADAEQLERMHENVRAAVTLGLERRDAEAVDLASSLAGVWTRRGLWTLAGSILDQALDVARSSSHHALDAILGASSRLAYLRSDFAAARRFASERLALAERDGRSPAAALNSLATAALGEEHFSEARELFERSVDAARSFGEESIPSLTNLGVVAETQGRLDDAVSAYTEALELARAHGSDADAQDALWNLANVLVRRGDYPGATSRYEEALRHARRVGEVHAVATLLMNLGVVASTVGDQRTNDYLNEALETFRSLGDRVAEIWALTNIANHQIGMGDLETARENATEGLAIARRIDSSLGRAGMLHLLGTIDAVERDAVRARTRFRESLRFFQESGSAYGEGMAIMGLGQAEVLSGDLARARRHFEEALELFRQMEDFDGIVGSLLGLTRVARMDERLSDAYRLGAEALEEVRGTEALGLKHATLVEASALIASSGLQPDVAAALAAAVRASFERNGITMTPADRIELDAVDDPSGHAHEEATLDEAARRGHAWSLDDASASAAAALAGLIENAG
jgi:predicted ATPase/DNA-binding SARP family transcriptional activator